MGEKIIDFVQDRPAPRDKRQADVPADSYYRFVKSLLREAAQNGLILPAGLETCARQCYAKNQDNDLISRMLHHKAKEPT